MSYILRDARKYEEINSRLIAQRPGFHLSARVGWMNDPNGFSWYKGRYHMFYQYYPYQTEWGPCYWGHAVSDDLLHWEYLPAALAPDQLYDRTGAFSGCAVTMEDGRQALIYTGNVDVEMPDGSCLREQTQNIAFGDGIDYVKYEGNPIMDKALLPKKASTMDFRDPKVFRHNGHWYCVTGSQKSCDHDGQLLLFRSEDLINWQFDHILVENKGRFGLMWECPDFFELDGKYVAITSPQDMLPRGFEYHNGDGTLCLIGSADENLNFTEEHDQAIDYGIDFYAPQTILTPDGRRVMIGWMQNWDTSRAVDRRMDRWIGQMTLPRELHLINNRLYETPVRELENLRRNKVEHHGILIDDEIELPDISGRRVDLTVRVRPVEAENLYRKFAIHFAEDADFHTTLSFHLEEEITKIDRKHSGSRRAIIHQRRALTPCAKPGEWSVRLILDDNSAEAFINNGEYVMTVLIYTRISADQISFVCQGKAIMDVEKYDLQ
ncbi:glycoside hydrolase family 32 protein [Galactobacillus timonensis]|uniref:glycoside hydrolase family 32 protein n=1 Tax=Galactobacillus timonensis TaxID=2041840 RepID=UPI000C830837|nr:glycoside hydrolase family 32 protein [Galactobacillus timonensis]